MVESPADTAALPTANPLREHGDKTAPLAQLLLQRSPININPASLRSSRDAFQNLGAQRPASPGIVPQSTERSAVTLGPRRQVCSEVNKALAPLQLTAGFVFCSFERAGSPRERAAEPGRRGEPRRGSWCARRAKLQSPSLPFGAKPKAFVPRSWLRCLLSKVG